MVTRAPESQIPIFARGSSAPRMAVALFSATQYGNDLRKPWRIAGVRAPNTPLPTFNVSIAPLKNCLQLQSTLELAFVKLSRERKNGIDPCSFGRNERHLNSPVSNESWRRSANGRTCLMMHAASAFGSGSSQRRCLAQRVSGRGKQPAGRAGGIAFGQATTIGAEGRPSPRRIRPHAICQEATAVPRELGGILTLLTTGSRPLDR